MGVKIIDKGALKQATKISGGRIQQFGELLVERARENTREFKGHQNPDPKKRPTGNLMRSIKAKKTGQMSLTVRTDTGYGAWVELGTRRMAAQPFMAPGFEQAKADFEKSGPWK